MHALRVARDGLAIVLAGWAISVSAGEPRGTGRGSPGSTEARPASAPARPTQPAALASYGVDRSTPRQALLTFCAAVQAEDVEGWKRCWAAVPDKAAAYRDGMIRYLVAQHRLNRVIVARLGKGPEAKGDGKDTALKADWAVEWRAEAESATVEVKGDEAFLRPKAAAGAEPWKLSREGREWKVCFLGGLDKASPADLKAEARKVEEGAARLNALAGRIEGGKVSAQEVLDVLSAEDE